MKRCLFFILMLAGFANSAYSDTMINLSVPGYAADIGVHDAEGKARDIIVIAMHGKEKGRLHKENLIFAKQLAQAGYTVYTPEMPWHDYSADVATAFSFLDALVGKVAAPGKKVVITGHSQGAPYALFYATAHRAPYQLAGVVLLSPGHLIHRSKKLREVTAADVALAKELVASGKGDERRYFIDINGGAGKVPKYDRTSAQIYMSYFDPETSPNFLEQITKMQVPIFWIDGEQDGLARQMNYAGIYETAPRHAQNRYTVVPGGHIDMLEKSAAPVIEWLGQFN